MDSKLNINSIVAAEVCFPMHQILNQKKTTFVDILKQSNSLLPHVVLASTLLALIFPPSFAWFTSR